MATPTLLGPRARVSLAERLAGVADRAVHLLALLESSDRAPVTVAASLGVAGPAVAARRTDGLVLVEGVGTDAAVALVSGGAVHGLMGPCAEVQALRRRQGLSGAAWVDRRELVLAVPTAAVPPPGPATRRAIDDDIPLVAGWSARYDSEDLGLPMPPDAHLRLLAGPVGEGRVHLALSGGSPVSMATVELRVAGRSLVSGVWTPRPWRGRGHGRAAVAALAAAERVRGVERLVLTTAATNHPALRCYAALGFQVVDEVAVVLFREPVRCALPGREADGAMGVGSPTGVVRWLG